jgi:opacity protein-like surface antigen
MRKITKLFAVATMFVALGTTGLKAQTMGEESPIGVRLGIGVSGGIGEDGSPFKNSYGADARLQLDLTKQVSITATGGYTRLIAKDNGTDYDFIPAKGGIKVFPIGSMYALGEIGAGFAIKDNSKTALIWSGGLGYAWKGGLDISARYEGYNQDSSSSTYQPANGQFALRLAYGFKL